MADIQILDLPPEEAIRFLREKGDHVGFSWLDTDAEQHARSFTVAKAMREDILADIRVAVDAALVEGTTFETFREELEPTLQKKGWWGRAPVTDPLTGETKVVQLGSVRRLRIIFDTNLRMAYSRGHWQRVERVAATRPWLRYVAVLDSRTRPRHRAWHGTVLRWDHPFWQTHWPPNGWRCRCGVQQLDDHDIEEFGLKVSDEPPAGWDRTRRWVNKRTGQVRQVPQGIDPGFDNNVGLAGLDVERLAAASANVLQHGSVYPCGCAAR